MPYPTSHDCLENLFNQFSEHFGEKHAQAIFEIIYKELWGRRITISLKYFENKIRNEKIRNKFTGDNYRELAYIYGLTERSVRNIVHKGP